MSLRSKLGRIRQSLLCTFNRRTVPLGDCGPIVSFAFDDFPRSAYSVGGAILEKYGARGTYYVTAGLTNTSNELGDLFIESDLYSLLEKGHEIASQTFHHSSCRSLPIAAFQADVNKGVKALEHLTGGNHINFAYPYGHVTLESKKALGGYLTSARSIIPGFNGPEVDLNLLRANSLYGGTERAGRAKELIAENARRRTWLIFYTHDVRPNPSEYGCQPELLEAAVACAARSGARILSVRETLAEALAGSKEAVGVAASHPV